MARALAMALRDPAVREEVKAAVVTSTVRDHKLHLTSFLSGRGGRVLASAYRNAGISEAEFRTAMASVREMEFYMPVAAHRQAWAGGSNVLVAVQVRENDDPVAFSLDGSRTVLSSKSPPATPVLAIVPMETDFRAQIVLNNRGAIQRSCAVASDESLENASSRCSRRISDELVSANRRMSLAVVRAPGSLLAATKLVPTTVSSTYAEDPLNLGLYATFLRALDLKEPWIEGPPETEIHVTGKRAATGSLPVDYQCAAEYANAPDVAQPGIRDLAYVFDMNDNFWQNGSVRLLSAAQLDSLDVLAPDGYEVSIWESDGGDCTVEQNGTNFFEDAANAAGAAARGTRALRARHTDWAVVAAAFREVVDFLNGDDDLVGLLVPKDSTVYAGSNPGNNFMIYDHATENGRATIVLNRTSRTTTMSGPINVTENTIAHYSASATGYTGSVSYTWYVDGELVQDGPTQTLDYGTGTEDFQVAVTATDVSGPLNTNNRHVTVRPAGCGKVC